MSPSLPSDSFHYKNPFSVVVASAHFVFVCDFIDDPFVSAFPPAEKVPTGKIK